MKTKVLLVDDEKLERVLIRKGYDWEGNGFEIIGEAGNGDEALEFFDVNEPDIVLTDISMPYMDGLVLAEKLNERSKNCRVIIITGYREFDYARKAIKLGVKDFLLKPVNIQDIASTMAHVREELKKEQGHKEEYNKLIETVTKNHDIVRESFLQRLVEDRIEEKEALPKLKTYQMESILDYEICMIIRLYPEQEGLSCDTFTSSENVLNLIRENQFGEVISFIHYLGNIVVFFRDYPLDQVCAIAKQIKAQINTQLNLSADIGISEEGHGYSGISKAFRQANKALSASVIFGRNTCITYNEYAQIKESNQETSQINWSDFIFCVKNCLVNKVYDYIDEITQNIRRSGITDKGYIKLVTIEVLLKSGAVVTQYGKSVEQLMGNQFLYEKITKIETLDDMNCFLRQSIQKILEFCDSLKTKKSNKLVEQAKKYIEEHLYESALTLKEIAKCVYTNECYLSRVFKQENGESLIEYIIRRRIEQSIHLLNTTDLKAYEIAEKVGIGDPHYFSICFKKQLGVTVTEYKNRNSENKM